MHSAAPRGVNPVPPVACSKEREILQIWKVPKWNQDWLGNIQCEYESNPAPLRTDRNSVPRTRGSSFIRWCLSYEEGMARNGSMKFGVKSWLEFEWRCWCSMRGVEHGSRKIVCTGPAAGTVHPAPGHTVWRAHQPWAQTCVKICVAVRFCKIRLQHSSCISAFLMTCDENIPRV